MLNGVIDSGEVRAQKAQQMSQSSSGSRRACSNSALTAQVEVLQNAVLERDAFMAQQQAWFLVSLSSTIDYHL